MGVLCRSIVVLSLLLAAGPRLRAASAADRAFDAAVKAFQDTFYARAEAQLADFRREHTNSPQLMEAILLQAQARIQLTNYAGAIELLTAHQAQAGTNSDQYLFWIGEAQARKGDWQAAGNTYARLVKEFPGSARCLDAVLGEASARAALAQAAPAEWAGVIALLQPTNSVFQNAARTNTASELVPRGYLLLSEAQFATGNYRAAEETLQPLAKRLMSPRLAWQWQFLLLRIQLAGSQTNAALQTVTNLLATAGRTGQTNLLAESASLQAGLLERLGRTNDAIVAYQGNLAEGIPAERQRQALLKITDLSLAENNVTQAAQMLEKFLGQRPDAASADLALLTLGELRLRQHESGASPPPVAPGTTNAPAATNNLQLAMASFSTLIKRFPQSPLVSKAQLHLGWCYWREGRLAESQAALQAAVERLPSSPDLAMAWFRLAEVQLQQTNYTAAIKSYQTVIEKFAALPEVKTNLFEPALYQTVRAGLAGGELPAVTNALARLLVEYPQNLNTARGVLLTAEEIGRRGDPGAARKLLLDFAGNAPAAPMLAERQLAVAATYEQQQKWAEAIAQYESWLASFTNHPSRPQAEYYRAWDVAQAGRETNALVLFTNFVSRFPTHELAPYAQMWVADHYYNARDFIEAERNYKLLFQNTNWPPAVLSYEAQLMAGRAAVGHQDWKSAKDYFTSLYNNTNGPALDVRLQAFFEYGQTLLRVVDPTDPNKLANLEEATRIFGRLCEEYPTNRLAVPAWIERGKCYLQWALAKQQLDSLTNAISAYQRVIALPEADVAARSEAKVGQAIALSKWAEQKAGAERTLLLKQALSNCLDVVYGTLLRDGERPDLFMTKRAGIQAFDLAESLQAWSQAVAIYQRLTNNVWPQLPASLEKRATRARENLEREKPSN